MPAPPGRGPQPEPPTARPQEQPVLCAGPGGVGWEPTLGRFPLPSGFCSNPLVLIVFQSFIFRAGIFQVGALPAEVCLIWRGRAQRGAEAEGHRRAAPPQDTALTPGPSVPLARGRERLWMQLGARGVGGAVWRSPPAPRWASGRAGSH